MSYSLAKKAVAEIVSTFILVSIGCGAAMGVHADPGVYYLAVALAFGMSVLIIAYGPGNISGGHANPAVSLGGALAALLFNWLSKEDVAEDDA